MKKNVRGYIFGKEFMGERAPQHIQNIAIRDFCTKNRLTYNLSLVEYVFKNSTFMLMEGIKELNNFYGIVMYSIFQLPESESERKRFLEERKTAAVKCTRGLLTNEINKRM